MKKDKIPTKTDISKAHERIKKFVKNTPVLTSQSINEILGTYLFFKCENFQKVGAFKFRGAVNSVLKLNKTELKNGVATHSSGNHAAALALAAKMNNTKAFIVMPSTAPCIKKNAVINYCADVFYCEPTLEAREETLETVVENTGAMFIHPYDNYNIIEGQATAAKELTENLENELDFIIAPVGGGGLISGTSLSAKYFSKNTKVIGAEPKGADDAFRSLRDGEIYPSVKPNTIADGLLTSLSERTFGIIKNNVTEILTVEEENIIKAMRMIWERMKIIVEPSSAVPLASIIENKEKFVGKNVGIIISGGNVDLNKLPF